MKTDERISRLEAACSRSHGLKQAVSGGFPPIKPKNLSISNSYQTERPSTTSDLLNPAPFLVNAVIEALFRDADLSAITRIVPGEADPYCARDARERNAVILTSDSDLLLYDLGTDGAVLFLKHIVPIDDGIGITLSLTQYRPRDIANRLKLPDLLGLGFVLSRGQYRSLPLVLEQLKVCDLSSEDFAAFTAPYSAAPLETPLLLPDTDNGPHLQLFLESQLDPRVSELLQSFGIPQLRPAPEALIMYLPPLMDDPHRASAWTMSVTIRKMAVSLLCLLDKSLETCTEFDRRGTRVTGTTEPLLRPETTAQAIASLLSDLRSPLGSIQDLPDTLKWRTRAARILLRTCREADKSMPSTDDLVDLITDKPRRMTWDVIHLQAQLQATLYSLRMLFQIAEFTSLQRTSGYTAAVKSLVEALVDLPGIADLFDPVAMLGEQRSPIEEKIRQCLLRRSPQSTVNQEDPGLDAGPTNKLKKRKKSGHKDNPETSDNGPQRGGGRSVKSAKLGSSSSNPFAALEMDE